MNFEAFVLDVILFHSMLSDEYDLKEQDIGSPKPLCLPQTLLLAFIQKLHFPIGFVQPTMAELVSTKRRHYYCSLHNNCSLQQGFPQLPVP